MKKTNRLRNDGLIYDSVCSWDFVGDLQLGTELFVDMEGNVRRVYNIVGQKTEENILIVWINLEEEE